MSQRKLQQEVDRCFKRVAEGIAAFESTFEKIQQATNQAQKEKLEDSLKREIKKLQRQRDLIKSWAAGGEIKDKKPLVEHRKAIETQMEKFKAVEKEMKTKAYSKEGLLASTKMDPKEKERAQVREFLTNAVSELELQIETCEAEAEGLQVTLKKGRKDASKADRVAEVERIVERHKWHIAKLELILRLLENGQLEVENVAKIQDDIRYYIDSNQDVDFTEDDAIYDDLNLDEEQAEDMYGIGLDDKMSSQDTQSIQDDLNDKPPNNSKDSSSNASIARRPSTQLRSPMPALATLHNPSSSTVPIPPLPGVGSSMKPAPIPTRPAGETLKYASAAAAAAAADRNVGIAPLPPPPGIISSTPAVSPLPPPNAPKQPAQKVLNTAALPAASSGPPTPLLNKAELVAANSTPSPRTRPAVPVAKEQTDRVQTPDHASRASSSEPPSVNSVSVEEPSPKPSLLQPSFTGIPQSPEGSQNSSPTSSYSQSALPANSGTSIVQPQVNGTNSSLSMPQPSQQPLEVQNLPTQQQPQSSQLVQQPPPPPGLTPDIRDATQDCIYHLPPGLQDLISSFESTRQRITNPPPQANSPANLSRILEGTLVNTPDTIDAEKPKPYKPVTKYHSPHYYPQEILPIFDDPKLYQRIDTDTLFYIFYYRQGTYQQYLAAKELKRQSWRFHKMYQTWFQRHEEPKIITDEFEQGTYRFFDYESTWMNRRKTEFKFLYKYLEDDL
ncbi:Not1 N-terminal domain, CCR4-Not complex component-domain-containing protein [Kalaharituber pfeilii]|nr:Not1 N-terminal domain, CCR4-Not complex component-domain-containing protein [Kalaharituber pfeilii]